MVVMTTESKQYSYKWTMTIETTETSIPFVLLSDVPNGGWERGEVRPNAIQGGSCTI